MKISVILGATVFLIFGILTMLRPVYYNTIWTYTVDFTNRRWVIGPLCIVVGALLIWTEVRKRRK